MKKIIYFLVLTLVFMDSNGLYSAEVSTTSSIGTEFYVAFPLNDNVNANTENFVIYVTSAVDNEVTVNNKKLGYNVTKPVLANETIEFSYIKGEIDKSCEITEFETAVDKGIRVTSEHPISVTVVSSKSFSSEGYMAIPTVNWGRDYIHNSFSDLNETREWGGGFVVLASEDLTEVVIRIKDGMNLTKNFGETFGGKQHGDEIRITLNAGEVYAVQGTGKSRGIFDLSGTHISSSKPIGLVSYHNRAMIPSTVVTSGRDYLVEMMPSTNAWGKEYISIELDRSTDKGDYFRVIAGEDNTTFDIVWYDKMTKEKITTIGPIKLAHKGDWYEYEGSGAQAPHELESIRGVASFKSDKPMLVVQYSYSAFWDGANSFDPFMIVLPPTEQYLESALFTRPQTDGSSSAGANYINIIALGDPTDQMKNKNLLGSLTLNDVDLTFLDMNFLTNNIPGTNYYWSKVIDTKSKSFNLQGNTSFGATVYGFLNFDSYGWSAGQNFKILQNTDPVSSVEIANENQPLKVIIVSANPMNSDLLRLSLSNEELSNVSVNITDLEGKVIMELMNEFVGTQEMIKEFNIGELKSGTYFISAADGTNQTTTKFIITK